MSFYLAKNVLVTGGASFIGSHLVDRLSKMGAKLTVVDDLSSGKIQNLAGSFRKIKFIKADLRNQNVALKATKNKDIVFHLANIHGGRGFIDTHPGEIVQNFLIDGNVFYAAHKNKVKRICFASSACVYPVNLQSSSLKENLCYLSEEMADPFSQGKALADREYGWAKFMAEMALKAYNKQFGLQGVSCRIFSVYGPRENETHAVIALIAKALLKQDPFEIWGSGKQSRNFTYIDDIVEGLLLACEKITDCRAVNLGGDELITIAKAAEIICELAGHKPKEFFFNTFRPEGVQSRLASTINQERWLGFKPKISFREGVQKTINWYKAKIDLAKLKETLA